MNSISINRYHQETDEWQYERDVGGGHTHHCALVDDHSLQWGQYRTTQDGHDEAGSTKLGIVAQSVESYTIDGGEHQRHASANAYQTV